MSRSATHSQIFVTCFHKSRSFLSASSSSYSLMLGLLHRLAAFLRLVSHAAFACASLGISPFESIRRNFYSTKPNLMELVSCPVLLTLLSVLNHFCSVHTVCFPYVRTIAPPRRVSQDLVSHGVFRLPPCSRFRVQAHYPRFLIADFAARAPIN